MFAHSLPFLSEINAFELALNSMFLFYVHFQAQIRHSYLLAEGALVLLVLFYAFDSDDWHLVGAFRGNDLVLGRSALWGAILELLDKEDLSARFAGDEF